MTAYRYGLARPADIAGKSGRAILEAIIAGDLPQAPISEANSFWLVEVGDGEAAFEGDTGPHLLNPAGTVHGGWALLLIDSATGCAGLSTLPADTSYTTVETKGNLTRPILASTGRVRCEARVVSRGRTIITAEATVRDAGGRVLAHGTSTLLVLPAGG